MRRIRVEHRTVCQLCRHRLVALAPLSVLLCACNIEGSVGGLADSLLDPDASSVDKPGRKIAEGSYSGLELDASLSVGARLLALRDDRDEPELAIIPFEGGTACQVGPATRFLRLASQVDVDLKPIVGFLGPQQNGRGTLRFVDFDCREVMSPLEDVALPQVLYPRSKPTGFLTLSGQGVVYFVDVVEPEISTVAENVRSGRVGSEHLWLVESGVLTARGDDFEVLGTYGSDVAEFALLSGFKEPGVTDVAFVENGNLFLATGTDGEPELLAEDACNVTDIGHSGAFAFYSPCQSRRLTLAYRSRLVGTDNDEVLVAHLSEAAIDPNQIDLFWGDGHGAAVFVTNADATADSGTLVWQGFSADSAEPEEAVEIANSAHIGTGSVLLLDYASGAGELGLLSVETNDDGVPELSSLERLADGVAQLPGVTISSSLGVLANFDSEAQTGDLVLFSQDMKPPPDPLAQRVPVQRHARDNTRQRSAFVGDYDGQAGTAYLLDAGKTTALGKGALPNTLQFLEAPDAVAYLRSAKGGPDGELMLYLLDSQLSVSINDHVNEFHGLPWPSAGLLYSVSEGSQRGIWFARAK